MSESNLDCRRSEGAFSGVECESDAVFSQCGKYRYFLQRKWSDVGGILLFLMLNPSVASESGSDPTALACQNRARALGYGGFAVCNLFARVESDSDKVCKMWKMDPMGLIGPDNDKIILEKIRVHGKVLCAWGDKGRFCPERVNEIQRLTASVEFDMLCIRGTKKKHPIHPLGAQRQNIPLTEIAPATLTTSGKLRKVGV